MMKVTCNATEIGILIIALFMIGLIWHWADLDQAQPPALLHPDVTETGQR